MIGLGVDQRPVGVTAAVLVLAGCAAEPPAVMVVSRDSVGIEIVENTAVRSSGLDQWQFSAEPVLEIGTVEGDPNQEFNGVIGAVRLSDGRILVGDRGSRELRFFDEEGNHRLTVGGPGEGPGEFGRLAAIDVLPGDTVVASDWPVGTLTWFDPLGGYVDKTRLGPFWPGLIGRTMADGSLLVDDYERGSYGNELEWWAATGQESHFRPTGVVVRVTRDGSSVDTLGEIVGEEWYKIGKLRQGLTIHAAPFARTTQVAWNRDRFFVGETGRPEVEVYRLDGALVQIVRWEAEPTPVTGDDHDVFRDEVLNGLTRPNRRPDYERWLAAVPYPESKPFFRELAADPSGHLWVQPWERGSEDRNRWLVFAPSGRLTAEVEVPAAHTILDLGTDYAVTVWKDDLDLEYVRIYHVSR